MITLNLANIGPVVLVLVLSLVIGVVASLLSTFAGFAADLFMGIAQIVAGGRGKYTERQQPNKAFIAVRAVIYAVICVAALAASMMDHQVFGYACAVIGGICLPLAIGKIIE